MQYRGRSTVKEHDNVVVIVSKIGAATHWGVETLIRIDKLLGTKGLESWWITARRGLYEAIQCLLPDKVQRMAPDADIL